MNATSNRMIYQTEETRENILTGAQRLFVEQGYADTQMKDIAAAVGISRHSLYRYYRDKLDLGFAVQSRVLLSLQADMRPLAAELARNKDLNARQRLVRSGLYLFSLEHRELDFCFLAEFDAFNSGSRLAADFLDHLPVDEMNVQLDYFYDLVRQGVADGEIRDDKPVEELVRTVFYSLQSLAYRLYSRGEALLGVSQSERVRMLANLCDLLEDGLK